MDGYKYSTSAPSFSFFKMDALGGGNGGFWWNYSSKRFRPFDSEQRRRSKGSDSVEPRTGGAGHGFPFKQAVTAGSLALTGDTIAQFGEKLKKRKALKQQSLSDSDDSDEGVMQLLLDHDWLRALRMTSYGFLLYGPGSYAWYQQLDRSLPKPTMKNLLLKILLNQIILGPCVIAVVFAWNNLWLRKLSALPKKYKNDAFPTLLSGFKFWIPMSALNFWLVPLQARVAFMSMGSIFWNFCLSSTMSK